MTHPIRLANLLLFGFLVFGLAVSRVYGQDGACYDCHGDPEFIIADEEGNEISMYVDSTNYANSVHGYFECITCHMDAEEIPHAEDLQEVDCGLCHDAAVEEYQRSIHAQAREAGAAEAPSCADCHGKHDMVPISSPDSRVHPLNLASTCALCHADPKIVRKYDIPIENPLAAYRNSVHGVALMSEQNFDAATCNSCHGSHDIRAMNDPESPIYWKHVLETCGQCHGEIYEQYTISVHWTAAERGVRNSPVCTDCHGEHEVRSPEDPESPVHPLRVSAVTCERCHGSELITQRYGLAEGRVRTYEDSYHGLAIKAGSLAAANCASCHGIHNILPSSDLRSLVHPANLQKTCGACHPKATKNFAKGPVHLTTTSTPGRVVQYVQNIYIALIVLVIGAMLLHNTADFIRRAKRKIRQREET